MYICHQTMEDLEGLHVLLWTWTQELKIFSAPQNSARLLNSQALNTQKHLTTSIPAMSEASTRRILNIFGQNKSEKEGKLFVNKVFLSILWRFSN